MSDKPLLVTYYADPPFFTRASVNDEYCKFFGVKREQVLGRSCLETTPEIYREKVREKIDHCIQNNAVRDSVETVIKPDGTTALIRWVETPVKDKTGKIIKMAAIGTPVPDRRAKRDRRQAALNPLMESPASFHQLRT
jgi:PAS domain S-box-containing protein